MALNVDAVGETIELEQSYTWKDVVLYALGVGATRDELDYLFEGRGPSVLPTYAVIPTYGACMSLIDKVGGDLLGVVHGAQGITLHKPFAPSGTLKTVGKVAGVYDMKRLAQAVFTTETFDEAGDLVCETSWLIMFRNDGGFGGPRPPQSDRVKAPAREPDFTVTEKVPESQALLYRLSGDLNPLHADPAIGEKAGFGQPILHGLCTYGYACRAIINQVCDGDASKMKSFKGQFRKPIWPGDTLLIKGWKEDGRVIVRTTTLERPEEFAFTNAVAEIAG